jgi:hypothetical protein
VWKITKINNETHEVTVTRTDGSLINFVVPSEHTVTSKSKLDYIKSRTDAHDLLPKPIIKKLPNYWKALSMAQAIIIILLILVKH